MDVALMTNLGWGDALVVAVDYHKAAERRRSLKIVFDKGPAFRTTALAYGLEYWGRHGHTPELGRTFVVENSAWIAELAGASAAFDALPGDSIRHYVILTDEYAVEVLSDHAPDIIDS